MAARYAGQSSSEEEDFPSDSDDSSSDNEVDRLARLAEEIFEESDDDEEQEFAGFEFEMPDDVTFQLGRPPVQQVDDDYVDDQPQAGPHVNIPPHSKPIDIFNLFFDDVLFQQIVDWTNANAAKKSTENPEKHKGKWTDTTIEEIRAFVATLIIMNDMVHVPRFERYFQSRQPSKWYASTPGISQIFNRDRYHQLKRYIHFSDPHIELPDRRDPLYDKLYKIRPVISHLQDKFASLYVSNKNISVDESMIPFKGRLQFKQRMPLKPVKYGIKLFEVCESKTGYCMKFSVYLGKQGGDDDDGGDLGKTGKVVVNLMNGFQHRGYELYIDNFYTSIPLLYFLSLRGIRACGTMRSNRKYFPKAELIAEAKRQKLKHGQFAYASYRDLCALLWKDRKDVFILTSIHDPVLGPAVKRKLKAREGHGFREMEIACPIAISEYNQHMGGVDLNDQLTSVRKDLKQLRWYFRVFLKMVMMATFNAFILENSIIPHKNNQGKIVRDILAFKDELVYDLIGQVRAPRKSGRKRTRQEIVEDKFDWNRLLNVGNHFPGKGEGTDHTCVVCREKRKRWLTANKGKDKRECPFKESKTTFVCLTCGDPPGETYICIKRGSTCFQDYHQKVQFWL